MSDIAHYFMAHAREATRKARRMGVNTTRRRRQRIVAQVYHLLAMEAACAPNVHRLDDFRSTRKVESQIGTPASERIATWKR
jgi:hypothetical protein